VLSGWGGAVPLWGGEVAKRVKDFNQGGMLWTFKLPKQLQQAASAEAPAPSAKPQS
jgi:alcohol dehydrogenase (cytochrome c)